MAIIKLTEIVKLTFSDGECFREEIETWVNTRNITYIQKGCIGLINKSLGVKETPEEILALIKEAENEAPDRVFGL